MASPSGNLRAGAEMPSRTLSPSIAVTVSVNSQCGSTTISRSPTLRLSMNMNVPLLWEPPGFTLQVTLCRLTCDLGSHSWTHPVKPEGRTGESFLTQHAWLPPEYFRCL